MTFCFVRKGISKEVRCETGIIIIRTKTKYENEIKPDPSTHTAHPVPWVPPRPASERVQNPRSLLAHLSCPRPHPCRPRLPTHPIPSDVLSSIGWKASQRPQLGRRGCRGPPRLWCVGWTNPFNRPFAPSSSPRFLPPSIILPMPPN